MVESISEKTNLRARMRQRLMAVDAMTRRERSNQAAAQLIVTPEFRQAEVVMIFLPLNYEINAVPIALRAWQEGKVVTVPLVSREQKHMLPVEIRGLDEPMETDGYGVRTPRLREPYPIESIDLVVVPGLGFDRSGRRIGRGGGFYDRFLAQPAFRGHGVACGLAMEEQVIDEVPIQPHDVDLDMLVTDRAVTRFHHVRS